LNRASSGPTNPAGNETPDVYDRPKNVDMHSPRFGGKIKKKKKKKAFAAVDFQIGQVFTHNGQKLQVEACGIYGQVTII